ncbi:MAG: SRPBCC family protein [Nitrososphaeraceae archaeon]
MPRFENSFVVDQQIDSVWKFYTDIKHLEIITPKKLELKIIKCTNPEIILGQECWIEGKIIMKKIKWHSKITFFRKHEYTDEMIEGPFKKWIHTHRFSDLGNMKTKIIDEIEYELPFGLLRKMLNKYSKIQLEKIFNHRKNITCLKLNKK